ncbi:hypothetical protein V5N11_013398 [Cardamine amara subsp. amara]|uniref:Retrotransposon gag domain-containing protein n=1 Tax=Cardamine amara subsp. amara TaxID=228776 RepID=A0ABD1C0F7_CARAN
MVKTVVLVRNTDGELLDLKGNLCNELGQRLDVEGNPIRTLADYNRREEFYTNRSAICPPPFQRNDFELKPQYYTLVGNHTFHAHPTEHPMDYIEKFEDLASRSLTTWKDTKKAFLENFYDDAKSEDLRNMIAQFSQGPAETFKAAWLRFKAYQRDCPHHGFDEVQLLRTFFSGIDWRYQVALDASSEGNFKTRKPSEANKLIENLAASNSAMNADFERKRLVSGVENSQMAEVKAMLDTMHNLLVNKKSVHFTQDLEARESDEGNTEEDISYVNGSGFSGKRFFDYQSKTRNFSGNTQESNYGTNQSSGFTPRQGVRKEYKTGSFTKNYENSSYPKQHATYPESEIKLMLDKILESQQQMKADFDDKIDALYDDIHGEIKGLSSEEIIDLEEVEDEYFGDKDHAPIDAGEPHRLTRMGNPATKVLDDEKETPVCVDRRTAECDDRRTPEADPILPTPTQKPEERVYKPKVPFPNAHKKTKQELEDAKCKAIMDKLIVEIPLIEAVKTSPMIRRYVKRMVTKNTNIKEGVMMISAQVFWMVFWKMCL